MTLLAGVLRSSRTSDLSDICLDMLRASPVRGSTAVRAIEDGAFGRSLFPKTPGDLSDSGPVLSPDARYLLTGDVRLDNADELASRLPGFAGGTISDVDLLALLWGEFGDAALRRVVGDYVLAIWDRRERQLTLARSVSTGRPLLYLQEAGLLAFASMPAALRRVRGRSFQIDYSALSEIIANGSYLTGRTMLEGVHIVRSGTAVHLTENRCRTEDLWSHLRLPDREPSFTQCAEELRDAMEQAVSARMRRTSGSVATHLSSGRDSSAVTVLAAAIAAKRGEELIALTGAPSLGFEASPDDQGLPDESRIAAQTARRFPNVCHLVCRAPATGSLADDLDEAHSTHFGPALNSASMGWWNATVDGAHEAGASVLLTGAGGNNTISAGGGRYLHEAIRELGWAEGLAFLARLGRGSPATRRNFLHLGIGALMPRSIYLQLQRWRGRQGSADWRMFREPLRAMLLERDQCAAREWTPRRNGFEYRLASLRSLEPSEPAFRKGRYNDLRDPTLDRRVIEACFQVPARFLVSRVEERPVYAAAFGDLLPREVVYSSRRGYQAADWYNYFSRQAVSAAFERYRHTPAVQDLIDLTAVDALLDRWPSGNWQDGQVHALYRRELGLAVALASFLHLHFA